VLVIGLQFAANTVEKLLLSFKVVLEGFTPAEWRPQREHEVWKVGYLDVPSGVRVKLAPSFNERFDIFTD